MPHYVVLYKFTEQGMKNVKSTVERAKEIQANTESRGFKIHQTLWTQGQYDLVVVLEAPDEQAMMLGLMSIASAGNAHSETMRAFTVTEMEQIVQRM
jgi:uncharacterized protein with GYD domain